jgi:ABC-type iron transport system FetAB permease component
MIAKVPIKTLEEKKLLLQTVRIPFLLLLVSYPTVYVLQQETGWLTYFLILCAFFASFDVWDTLILDCLIFCFSALCAAVLVLIQKSLPRFR